MTEELTIPVVELFEDDDLNELTGLIFRLDEDYEITRDTIKEKMYEAFHLKWEMGKQLWIYEEIVKDHFDTWAEFAEAIGKNPSQISRAKKGYEYLLDAGAETWEEVLDLLQKKQISPTVKNFEGIGRLLNAPEPDQQETLQEREPKDLKRMQELQDEVEEILERNSNKTQPVKDSELELAEDTLNYMKEAIEKMKRQDIYNVGFQSESYLEFIRNYGRDLITGKACERCEPHHAHPDGGTGNYAEKLPDWTAIPLDHKTHKDITEGRLEPTAEQILRAQVQCLATFIITYT